ncbi:MAG: hypothetical protein HYY04_07070 [Chloroflexi bacterium]|nr:hypothetical protein [Chloroflexota bacterium]
MPAKRITIVGAGGLVFTPSVMLDLMERPALAGSTLVLHDVDEPRLTLMTRIAGRLRDERRADIQVATSLDPRRALDGADFVITTISVGGLEARRIDVEIPLRYHVYQTSADTVGPGGLSRALRTVPPIVRIARQMEEACPDAWLFNYTNPMSMCCLGISQHTRTKVVGLCPGYLGTERFIARVLDVPRESVRTQMAGLNHAAWITALRVDSRDGYPAFRERLTRLDPGIEPISRELFDRFGLYPEPVDKHLGEFFPAYLTAATDGGKRYGQQAWPAERILAQRQTDLARVRRVADGREPTAALASHEREQVVDIISAIVTDTASSFVVNVPNQGHVPNLPRGAIIEIPALVSGFGVQGLAMGPLPAPLAAHLSAIAAEYELGTAAALAGDRALALRALMADPLIRSTADARSMLDDLLSAHAPYLPQFATRGA